MLRIPSIQHLSENPPHEAIVTKHCSCYLTATRKMQSASEHRESFHSFLWWLLCINPYSSAIPRRGCLPRRQVKPSGGMQVFICTLLFLPQLSLLRGNSMKSEEKYKVLLLTQSKLSLRYLEQMVGIWQNELTLSVIVVSLNHFIFSCITFSWNKQSEG